MNTEANYRADIQSLRALAVVAVIVDHFFNWPGGGFVGVDVFFVISGFLITGLMLREHERSGRISWSSFYRRRVKRIMPAAVLVMLVTLGVSYLVFLSAQFRLIVIDAVWSGLFLSNWHFAAVGTDYWQADGPVSPLRHFWSLAVEEQFYIIWPLLLVAVFAITAKLTPGSVKLVLFSVMAVLAVVSFLWGMHETATNATVAYFSTFSRAWELALGALLAVAAPLLVRMPGGLRIVLSYSGFFTILASLFLLDSTSTFPAPWALLPVIGSGLVIGAGIGGVPRGIPLLTNPVSVYLGKISYSLYLWHFPVIICLAALTPPGSITFAAWALGITVYLSVASFHLVEDPVRRSAWLESPTKKAAIQSSRLRTPFGTDGILGVPKIGLVGLLTVPAMAVCLIALSVQAPQSEPAIMARNAHTAVANAEPPQAPAVGPASATLVQQISAALAVTEWPDVVSSALDDSSADWPASEYGSCAVKDYSRPDACVFGPANATKSIVVLGDSLGARLVYLLHHVYPDHKIYGFVRSGCISTDVEMTPRSAKDSSECLEDRASAIEATNDLDPSLVFIINNSGGVRELQSQAKGSNASDEWAAGLSSSIDSLELDPSRVVVVSPPPEGKSLEQCATKVSLPDACASTVTADWRTASVGDIKGAEQTGANYLNTLHWYCSEANMCPAFVGQTILKRDSIHPTAPFLDLLVEPMKEELTAASISLG